MTVVVDTNVVAYFLLMTEPYVQEASSFWSMEYAAWAPASWEGELVNVVWKAIRAGVMDEETGLERLRLAECLGIHSEPVSGLWEGALVRASRSNHPPYDTLFVELAIRLQAPLATFDRKLLSKFPDVALRPADIRRWQVKA